MYVIDNIYIGILTKYANCYFNYEIKIAVSYFNNSWMRILRKLWNAFLCSNKAKQKKIKI